MRNYSLASLTFSHQQKLRFLADANYEWPIAYDPDANLMASSCLDIPWDRLRGKTILLATALQISTVMALLTVDGLAKRVLLATPDLQPHFPAIIAEAGVDLIISEAETPIGAGVNDYGVPVIHCMETMTSQGYAPARGVDTQWVLFTSGTTGRPKMALHTLASLAGPLDDGLLVPPGSIWSTFYDIRRYGGLQILLRALLGGGSMVLSDSDLENFLYRAGMFRVTHISGTPSHWRKALMSGHHSAIHPQYVRLSGEIADQNILDRLAEAYPESSIAHAFASTEAGVAFDVRDGLEGFPASYLNNPNMKAELKVENGTLRIRSSRTASGYLDKPLAGDGEFVDTGDLVYQVGDRFYFAGRIEGVINVGGQKVHPEEVEKVILEADPAISMVRVWARASPITGSIVAAKIVMREGAFTNIRDKVVAYCQEKLPPWKVPVSWQQQIDMEMTASGKIARHV